MLAGNFLQIFALKLPNGSISHSTESNETWLIAHRDLEQIDKGSPEMGLERMIGEQ